VFSNRFYPVDRQIVSSLELVNRDFRLDPSRYNEKGERILRHLKQLGVPLLKIGNLPQFIEVFLPNRFSRVYVNDPRMGVPMLGTSTMFMTILPKDAAVRKDSTRDFRRLWVKEGDILISRSGTVASTVLCGASYATHIASDDCFRLRLTKDICGYVAAYLQSYFGHTLLVRDAHGKVIKHLKDYDIVNVPIPLPESAQVAVINNLMIEAQELVDLARQSFQQAEHALRKALGFDPETESTSLWLNAESRTFLLNGSSLFHSRLDPHFNAPDALHIRNILQTTAHRQLGEVAQVWMPTRFARPKAEPGYGVRFYSSADIMRARRLPSSTVSNRAKRYLDKCIVRSNTILICRSGAFGGIMGRAAYTTASMDGWAITEHMVRVLSKDQDFPPEYLYSFLASPTFGYPLVASFRHGKDVPELDPKELKVIPVPVLTRAQQDSITEPVKKAFGALDQANEKENQAHEQLLKLLKWAMEEFGDSAKPET